jgi:cation diffusion facilitator CzcD-associated flavoprotein CzcO
MGFPGYPFPSDLPSFPEHKDVLKYLKDYSEHYDLEKYIKVI